MNPWFRFYSETLRDRKLEHIARITEKPKALVIGVWAILLSLANDSPIPGALYLTENIPLKVADLERETGMGLDGLLDHFFEMKMLTNEGGVFVVTHWKKRQFKSDNSTSRVKRFRDKQRETERNVSETLHERFCNLPDTDTDTDIEEHVEKTSAKSALSSSSADYHVLRKRWKELFPQKPQPRPDTKSLIGKVRTRMKEPGFREDWETAMLRVVGSKWCLEGGWFTFGWFVNNDSNYRKCFNGNYDNSEQHGGNGGARKSQSNAERDLLTNQPFQPGDWGTNA